MMEPESLLDSYKAINKGVSPKILPAKEALEKTKQIHLNNIESFIKRAIEAGKCECEILPSEQFVSDENKQILRDAGYTVIEKESMLGKEILIKWENA